MSSNHNIFVSILDILNIKHTKKFSNKLYNEHPYKNNMYGFSCMLSEYGIENKGFSFKNKGVALQELEAPFITKLSNDLVVVGNINSDTVEVVDEKKKACLSKEEFIGKWSGQVLLVESDEHSIEPNYKENLKAVIFHTSKYIILFLAFFLALGIISLNTGFYNDISLVFALLINIAGAYTSYLLVLKQLRIQSGQANKICSLLTGKNDCDNILESDAAKLFGFSWSEIGLGYFAGNMLIIILLPHLYIYTVLMNVCALPYTLWSIWHQKFRAKQWCPLCLIVQSILWMLFIYNLLMGLFFISSFNIQDIILTGSIYVTPVFFLNLFIPILSEANNKEKISQELNSLKTNDKLFNILVKENARYEIDKTISTILLGNKDSENIITIVSNPHCNPCAQLHKKLNHILKTNSNGFCIRYIFSSFDKKLEECCRFFIAMYQKMNQREFLIFLEEWYKEGKYNTDAFFTKYRYDKEDATVQAEFDRHKGWLLENRISKTPTILFNGYELPMNIYKIEDITLLSKLKIS